MNRRSFLRLLGGTAVATVAAPLLTPMTAPLYVPSQNLDFGVPRRILTATEMPAEPWPAYVVPGDLGLSNPNTMSWRNVFLGIEEINAIIPIPERLLGDVDFAMWADLRPEIAREVEDRLRSKSRAFSMLRRA